MKHLQLAHGLSLPIDAVTQTLLIVGKRGSGKSSTATKFAERLIDARIPIAVLDPVDVWWGLKAGADGRPEGGKEVYIFGGRHPDLPLEATGGAVMADVIVDDHINAVMCLRGFTEGEKAQFVTDFADRLYRRNRDPLHVFCEEAHRLMPQTRMEGTKENIMLNRMLRLWTEGRTSGLGLTAITQRVARLHKDATTQAEILVAHRLIGPQDVKAVDGWIEHHHQQELRQQVLSTLAELKTGDAWVWAPDFPEDNPIGLKRVHFTMPETFDSRRTPKPGEHRTEPKQLAPVDLKKLEARMKATIDRAKQEDPRLLRAEIAHLKTELSRKQQVSVAKPIKVEVPTLKNAQIRRLEQFGIRLEKTVGRWFSENETIKEHSAVVIQQVRFLLESLKNIQSDGARSSRLVESASPVVQRPAPRTTPSPALKDTTLSKQERSMLEELARRHPVRLTRGQLATLSGYSMRSSQFGPAIRILIGGQYVSEISGELVITDKGLDEAGVDRESVMSPDEVARAWLRKLPPQPAAFFRVLLERGPMRLEELAEQAGYSTTSSQFKPSVNTLVRNGLVEVDGENIKVNGTVYAGVG